MERFRLNEAIVAIGHSEEKRRISPHTLDWQI